MLLLKTSEYANKNKTIEKTKLDMIKKIVQNSKSMP
jgi:hypothetical protein